MYFCQKFWFEIQQKSLFDSRSTAPAFEWCGAIHLQRVKRWFQMAKIQSVMAFRLLPCGGRIRILLFGRDHLREFMYSVLLYHTSAFHYPKLWTNSRNALKKNDSNYRKQTRFGSLIFIIFYITAQSWVIIWNPIKFSTHSVPTWFQVRMELLAF